MISCEKVCDLGLLVDLFESLVENARFGDLARRFLHASREMCAGISIFVSVSRNPLVLELQILRFCESREVPLSH